MKSQYDFRDAAGNIICSKMLKNKAYAVTWAKQRGYTVTTGAVQGPSGTFVSGPGPNTHIDYPGGAPIPIVCPICGDALELIGDRIYRCDECENVFEGLG